MNKPARLESAPIPFIDVAAQRRRLGRAIDDAIARVLDHCQFILGPEVRAAEADLAAFCGARHAITCASGTDALVLPLMAKGIGPGDAVICPTFTFTATAEVVALVGATPVFADVEEATFNLDPASFERAIATARKAGLTPKAVIPVDLFGQPADFDRINAMARAANLFVLDDAAQAFGATYGNRRIGTLAHATATSFFPAKPLGVYGDGGAVFTDDDELAAVMRSLRMHGEGKSQYDCVRIGMNGRFDTIQAAVLIEKLKIFPDEIARAAARRASAIRRRCRHRHRAARCARLDLGVGAVHAAAAGRAARRAGGRAEGRRAFRPRCIIAKPVHHQDAYRSFPVAEGGTPVAERLADEVISLPMHAYLDEPTQDRIIDAVRRALSK